MEEEHNERLTPATEEELQKATASNPVMKKLTSAIVSGWPDDRSLLDDDLKPYWSYRDELSIYNGIIYKGPLCVIPPELQSSMLEKIHANHLGADSNSRMARQVLFWPGMPAAITDMCQACPRCAEYGKSAPKEPLKPLPIPERSWQLISQDTFELNGKDYLISVCHFSDWFEVDELPDLSAETIIAKTEALIARYGVPDTIHSDCAPGFTSDKYKLFAKAYGFKKTYSSPYHSQGNGKAESAVKIAKSMAKKSRNLNDGLLMYRNTPPQGHTYTPAQRMFGRRTRTRLPTSVELLRQELIDPKVVRSDIMAKRRTASSQYNKSSHPFEHSPLDKGSNAYVKPPPAKRGSPWPYGHIIDTPRPRSYKLQTPTGVVSRNRVQLRPAAPPVSTPSNPTQIISAPPSVEPYLSRPIRAPPSPSQPGASETVPTPEPNAPNISLPADAPATPFPAATSPRVSKATAVTRSGRVVKTPSHLKDFICWLIPGELRKDFDTW